MADAMSTTARSRCYLNRSFPPYMPISLSPDGQWVAFTLRSPRVGPGLTSTQPTAAPVSRASLWDVQYGSQTSKLANPSASAGGDSVTA